MGRSLQDSQCPSNQKVLNLLKFQLILIKLKILINLRNALHRIQSRLEGCSACQKRADKNTEKICIAMYPIPLMKY
jgi:recombinational DNA repair protein RecR